MPFNDVSKTPPPLPSPELTDISSGISLLRPLSRRGTGPGMIILTLDHNDPLAIRKGVPSQLMKWAEEGYTVVEIQARALLDDNGHVIPSAVKALESCEKCEPKGKIGLVAYDPSLWEIAASTLSGHPSIIAAAVYTDASQVMSPRSTTGVSIPVICHCSGNTPTPARSTHENNSDFVKQYYYPKAASYLFATPFHDAFHYNTEAISHTRNLTFFKPTMGGPFFDLETIWEEHTYYEFADRSLEHTMSTMVQEPYVNHVPTMTGGIGRESLSHFYLHNFIFSNSADAELELISRTIGIDRVVDEFIFNFTHDQVVDWILPGLPPTNKRVEVPCTAVVNIRGDRLYHEHISWDQGTVLRQIGLMPDFLPFPYDLHKATATVPGGTFEYRVPVGGVETAEKMRDRNAVSSNQMFEFRVREV